LDEPSSDERAAADVQTTSLSLDLEAGPLPALPDGSDSVLVRGYSKTGRLVLGPVVIEIPEGGVPELDVPTSTSLLDVQVMQGGAMVAAYAVHLATLPASSVVEVSADDIERLTATSGTTPPLDAGDVYPFPDAADIRADEFSQSEDGAFTVVSAGLYLVTVSLDVTDGNASSLAILLDGTPDASSVIELSDDMYDSFTLQTIVSVSADQVIALTNIGSSAVDIDTASIDISKLD
jgi:hypothetical protein